MTAAPPWSHDHISDKLRRFSHECNLQRFYGFQQKTLLFRRMDSLKHNSLYDRGDSFYDHCKNGHEIESSCGALAHDND